MAGKRPTSPPPSPVLSESSAVQEYFHPSSSDLSDSDSVLLPLGEVTAYLDQVLCALGLHTEARTSFITYVVAIFSFCITFTDAFGAEYAHYIHLPRSHRYWLPSFLRHKHIALRFLPQSAYERAAPLDIVPRPDIVTRVFMLFKGITDDDLPNWENARARVATGGVRSSSVAWWKDVVGVDLDKALDVRLYRALEWGGMEVLRPGNNSNLDVRGGD